MNRLVALISGLRALLNPRRARRELDEEMTGYLEAATAHKQSLGMSPEAARRAALVEIGSASSVKQQVWESRWESTLEILFQDLRLSIRLLLKRPGFTLVALLSLALGIGANVAIFTLVRQVLLQQLPVRDPQLLVTFGRSTSSGIGGGVDIGQFDLYPWYFTRQLEADPGPFQGIAAFGSFSAKVLVRRASAANNPDDANAVPVLPLANLVSGNYFQVLGARALMGRTILPTDAASPGTGAVVVLSYKFWRQFFASDPSIIGRTLTINSAPFTVIGVMPKPFQGIKFEVEPIALWTPDTMQPVVLSQPSLLTPDSEQCFWQLFGRLAPDAASNKAVWSRSQAWLNQRIHNAIREHDGGSITSARAQEINREVVPLIPAARGVSSLRRQYGDSLLILTAVVVLILLIACANLANFLLARASARQREIATRLALGSSRARIVSQSLIESFLLSSSGGILGLGLAFVATRALIAFISQGEGTDSLSPTPDLPILVFTLALSLLTALLFGLAPALASSGSRKSLSSSFTTRNAQAGGPSRFWPKALVAVQIILSFILLIGAGLFIQTLRNLQNQDYGFERTHLLVAQFNPKLAGYKPSQTAALHQQLIARLSALPSVRSVALAATPPINNGGWSSNISLSGYNPAPNENMLSMLNRVSGGYFKTTGIPIVAGRAIDDNDRLGGLKVAVVNQTLANHFFPKGDALGHVLTVGIDSAQGPWQIVGIARDTRSNNPRNTDPIRTTYLPLAQIEPLEPSAPTVAGKPTNKPAAPEENQNRFASCILVRTTGDPTRTISSIRSTVSSIDPDLPLFNIATSQEVISTFISHDELISGLTSVFSLLALLLAAIGLYGVMSYSVESRRSEIGIRVALGANLFAVRWMVVSESLLLLVIGLAAGVPLALASKQFIEQQLFGLSALDPVAFTAAILVIAGMTLFASWLPAQRASKVDPIVALRAD